ncbi:PTS sugar transporter subunit IIA [Halorhabdus rudnickae]|uniref:PTS sugar transporter subunit IIA n=1 Tax=Halorhabdus rudnickae TaxID=1775544 RepID=UPI00108230F6|nr:PTS sugar transporter subunit IIA [Halorhabdus rudnickae]
MDEATIDHVITEDLIVLEEPPANKTDAIEYLLDIAVEAGRVTDREAALEAALERERQSTTGVGKGIGIPHAKTDAVTEPTVAFTRSTEGIDFDSMDDEPAKLLFLLLVPAEGGEAHLGILSSLSRALMHDAVREDLRTADSRAAVKDIIVDTLT